jgi:RHS repeat-associated protein
MQRANSNYFQTHDRYLFQGQEMDDEVKGDGNSVNYSFRMHDPRLGRFFAIDPLVSKFPYYSPYSFSGNRVVDCIELEGLEPSDYRSTLDGNIISLEEYAGPTFQMDEIHITNEKITFSGLVTYEFVQFSYIEKTEPINSSTPVPNKNQGTGINYVPNQEEVPASANQNPIPEINSDLSLVVSVETTIVGGAADLTMKEIGEEALETTVLKTISKSTGVGGGVFSTIDNGIQSYNDFNKGNYGRGTVNTTQTALYASGTAMLFIPGVQVIGGFILLGTTISDLIQTGVETQTGTDY